MNNMLPTSYQQFIHKSRYARWLDDEARRENWDETVERYIQYMVSHVQKKHGYQMDVPTLASIKESILSLEVMPSMRAMMTAGLALERDNICGYTGSSYWSEFNPRVEDPDPECTKFYGQEVYEVWTGR